MGAADFIKKPYDMPEKIMARVKRIIALYEDRMIIQSTEKDELTGLLSKSYFFEYASLQDRFYPNRSMDALTVNVSHFHLYNELYGVQEGNEVLKIIAKEMEKFANAHEGIACRSEGDNFYLYVAHQAGYEGFVNDVIAAITGDTTVHNTQIRIGINSEVDKSESLEMSFERARMAGDSIRESQKEKIAFYDAQMRQQRMFEETLIRNIVDAIINGEILVWYQPKYNVEEDTPRLVGAEALVRWNHPQYGMLSPGKFVSLFEENGLIQVMDEYIWGQAAAQVKTWKEKFGVTIPISVNVSRIDIMDEHVVETICNIADSAGIDRKDLHLEITESAYASDTENLVDVVAQFQKEGFVIEMDDFGSGYSSLNMLTMLPIDVLKVDMRFMTNLMEDEKSLRMMELIKEIADFLNVPMIAEGVEEKEQMDILKKMGYQMIQGYYFSKPVPKEEFENFIKD